MLPSELLFSHRRGPNVYPRFIKKEQLPWADAVLSTIAEHLHKSRGELLQALRALEGDSPDYRLVRGFAHLALNAAEFVPALQEPEPEILRAEIFARAAEQGFGEPQTQRVLAEFAQQYAMPAESLRDSLYADLPERHLLTALPDFRP